VTGEHIMFDVIFYKNRNCEEPIKEYLIKLSHNSVVSKKDRIQFNKINSYIQALKIYGTRIGSPVIKHIEDDIWELRPLNNRIFFFYWRDNTFVLLHHFLKKTNKTPAREIEKARNNMKDFLERI
jgi:phage-related protein